MYVKKPVPYHLRAEHINDPHLEGVVPELYLAEVHNITFVGGLNFLVGEQEAIIYDLAAHVLAERYDFSMSDPCVKYYNRKAMMLDLPSAESAEVIDRGIIITGLAAGYWAHWMLEYAPRFWIVDQFPEYRFFPLLIDEAVFADPHIVETLRLLAGKRPQIVLKANRRYFCKNLIVPSRLVHMPHDLKSGVPIDYHDAVLSETAIRFLREKLFRGSSQAPRRKVRIYMPRRPGASVPYRHLQNDAEVESVFSDFGFIAVEPHKLSYSDKVELFASAEAIAGAGSSGFVNAILAPAGTKCFCLESEKNMHQTLGPTMHKLLGQPLITILCQSVSSSLPMHHWDYVADLDLVRKILVEVLGG